MENITVIILCAVSFIGGLLVAYFGLTYKENPEKEFDYGKYNKDSYLKK